MRKRAFLFPGQGAQKVGMGRDLCDVYEPAAEVFREAEQACGLPFRTLCFEGPIEELTVPNVCQPALLTVSVAFLRVIKIIKGDDAGCQGGAGLSLGEYTALVCAEALAFSDAVKLVQQRGQFMKEAAEENPGGMVAVQGLEDEVVEEICRQVSESAGTVCPANYNSPDQLVISGENEAVEKAAQICQEKGARNTVRLNVAGAYHSPLMDSAADKLGEALQRTFFKEPSFPVVANYTGEPYGSSEEIRDSLTKQVCKPVRWKQSMQWLFNEDFKVFREIGPGRVLTGLMRRIDRRVPCVSINSAEALSRF